MDVPADASFASLGHLRTGNNDAADVAKCHSTGEVVKLPQPDTIADGLRGGHPSVAVTRVVF